ncbi:MAG: protein kinase [Chloroflexales bacterium]|nr:protein kinase [Chloroflexales bacterium]
MNTTPLQPGALLQHRYRIGRVVGFGGMGAVYEVTDERLDARAALKQIVHSSPALREAFEREARLLRNLRHRSLPRVFDYFTEADADFLVMDFIAGPDIATLIQQQGALPVDQVLLWADALLDVLIYLHTSRPAIIHRDIKPQNIKIGAEDIPVLLDFGIAKGNAGVTPATSSEPSIAAYTRPYAPIEQILGMPTTAQSDLFSLGATLYHMLTAQLPVAANRRQDDANHGRPDPLRPACQVNGRVPSAVSDVLQDLLGLHASDRPTSAAEARQALNEAMMHPLQSIAPAPTELGDGEEAQAANPGRAARTDGANIGVARSNAASVRPARSSVSPVISGGRSTARATQRSLQKRIHARVRRVLDSYDSAWMVWCDPKDEWRPLLERVAADTRLGAFRLVTITEQSADAIGSLTARRRIQQLMGDGESFVLLVQADCNHLGWMWAQALLAEETYTTSLRDQLLAWGWQPQSAQVSAQEIVVLARQGLQQDPATWGGGQLQPDLPLLLEVLAGGAAPGTETRYILDLTTQQAGLSLYEEVTAERWRIRSLARLLVTQAHEAAPRLIGEHNELLIGEGSRAIALDLLYRWIDSLRLSRGLAGAILEADKIAALDGQVRDANLKHGPFLSRAAEFSLFTSVCTRLAQKSGKDLLQTLAGMHADLERHVVSFWGAASNTNPTQATLAIPWSELARLSRAAQALLDAVPTQDWSTPEQAIHWYCSGGWRLDNVGEEFLRHLNRSTPELLALITPLRKTYRARWERTLIQWSEVWIAAGRPTPKLATAGEWLKQALTDSRPTAVLMLDALRYDLGVTLAAMINNQEGTERAALHTARAPLPSITALGMSMALPLDERDLHAAVVEGRWRVIDSATQLDLSVAENRRVWLRTRGIVPNDGILALNDVAHGRTPQPSKERKVIVITDDLIDQLGHDDELESLGGGAALDRYRSVITQLRDAGWRRVLVVTDHGYLHWAGADEKRLAPPVSDPAYRSRRALAYPISVPLAEPHVLAPGGTWRVLPARGASAWSAYGKLGYFHGGASLQEWIIPCLQIEWPAQAQPVGVVVQSPAKGILSAQPRIIVHIERGSIFIDDALPRHIEVLIRNATNRIILFRSDPVEVTPQQTTVSILLRRTPQVAALRDTALRIEVRDTLTEEMIDAADSVLNIDLDDW